MSKTFGEYCKMARENAGYTQEQTEKLLLVCWRSISDYECNITIPKADVVMRMMDTYNAPWLGYPYLRCNEVGQALLPEIPIGRNLSASILDLQVEMGHVANVQTSLAEVGRDDHINEKEWPIFEKCKQEMRELVGSAFSVIMAQKRKTACTNRRLRKNNLQKL